MLETKLWLEAFS